MLEEKKLYSPRVVKEVMDKYGFRFSKSLGQNFLIDKNIINKICDAVEIDDKTGVIEIGPGLGTLTQSLVTRAKKVVAVEIDKNLINVHKETLPYNNLDIIYDDFLKIDIAKILDEKLSGLEVKVAANLPYYITTPIIMKILEGKYNIKKIVLMVQKEVADRLTAKPGTKEYGSITLAVQYYCDAIIEMIVPNTVFMPRPKVSSAVVVLNINENPKVNVADEKLFFSIIKAAFGLRRKTLLNSLSGSLKYSKDEINKVLEKCDIKSSIRGEKLSLEQFAKISNEMSRK